MEVVDVRSSSGDLSSAPQSDVEGSRPTSHPGPNNGTIPSNNHNHPNASSAFDLLGSKSSTTAAPVVPKVRKPRAKKIKDGDASTASAEKKPRKPRAAPGTSAAAARKKQKTESGDSTIALHSVTPAIEAVGPRIDQTTSFASAFAPAPTPEAAKYTQNGVSSTITTMQAPSPYNPVAPPPPPPPATKPRAMFDPVRGMTTERSHDPIVPIQPPLSTPPRPTYQPTSSPSLLSIMNPTDNNITTSIPPTSSRPEFDAPRPASAVNVPTPEINMEIDIPAQQERKAASEAPAPKPVPKPRAKEQPPPLPSGSGLLSSSLFGGDSGIDSKDNGTEKGPNIVLHVDLKDPNNKVINFARMAEEKYGFAALYPRQAAQKERLARVAAAGAALERSASVTKNGTSAEGSADEDLSVDIDRDSDNDGDVAMSGVNGTGEAVNSGTDGPTARKRRKRKDEYDAEDPFVDDSELLWEAQAAASKDGFFVYCGPLVPEGEKPTVERADGTVKRGRGRGRGGGPGSRGGRGAAAAARAAEGGGSGRGGGPGSRGGGITRKPRITKAERQQREMEKTQREQMAVLAAKPTPPQS